MNSLIIIINRFAPLLGGAIAPPPVYPPRAPANLRLVGVTQQHLSQVQIEWAWDAVTDFGGHGATGVTYESEYREVGGNWGAGGAYSNTALSRTIAVTEDADTRYEFRVRAVNNLNAPSAWSVSAPVAATTGQQQTGRDMQWAGRAMQWAGRAQVWGQ